MRVGVKLYQAISRWLVLALSLALIAVGLVPANAVAPLGNSTFLSQTQTQNLSGINGANANASYLAQTVTLNGVAYYIANGPTTGPELYSTDGTASGTNLVKDVWVGASGYANNLAVSNGRLFFSSNASAVGNEPFISDGTGAGTVLLKDINPGGNASFPSSFVQGPNGLTYFLATDGTTSKHANNTSYDNGSELWVTDGTSAGTVKVKDMNTWSYQHSNSYHYSLSSQIQNLTSCNGKMFFTAVDSNIYSYSELYVTDGTFAGTQMVKNINATTSPTPYPLYSEVLNITISTSTPVSVGSQPMSLTCMGSTLFFSADDGTGAGRQLWKSDGTEQGTVKVRGTADGSSPTSPTNLAVLGDKLIFSAAASSYGPSLVNYGTDLWISDGTTAGTVLLKDINASTANSNPNNFTLYNNQLFFVATDYRGAELWKTDGTTVGTLFVKDINTTTSGASSSANNFKVWNGKLFFTADNGVIGRELYVTQGTGVTTTLVKDVFPGISDILDVSNFSTNQPYFAETTNSLVFTANSPIYGQEMWSTNGTEAGTQLLQDLNALPGSANAHDAIAFNGKIYFSAASAYFGQELWSTDLTTGNTVQVIDIYPGASSGMDATVSYFTIFQGRLYFIARSLTSGWELWSTDGTAAGTTLAFDLQPGVGIVSTYEYYFPRNLTVCNGKLFVNSFNGSYQTLFAFDGSGGAPVPMYTGWLYSKFGACLNNVLYFQAQDSSSNKYDYELWKSGGTAATTSKFYDAWNETYVSSGTTYNQSSYPSNLTTVGSKLFFTANGGGASGNELFVTDGTTTSLVDIFAGANSSNPSMVVAHEGALWFRANNGSNGNDLMSYDGTTLTPRDTVAGSAGPSLDSTIPFVSAGGLLWFRGNFSGLGQELATTDGTAANTGIFEDLSPGSASTTISRLTAAGSVLIYNTYDTVMGSQPRFVVASTVNTVTFNGNSATGGSPPADIAVMAISANIPGNTGALVRTGFNFTGWNTNAAGTGTTYLPGTSITPIVDTPLFAMWASVTGYTITYNANSSTGGVVAPPMTNVTTMVNLDTNSGALTRTGFSFGGWNTNSAGTGTNYASGARYTPVADVTLYARWIALTPYNITFSLNGATGTAPATINTYATATVTLPSQGSMIAPAGKTFAGWNTNAAGTGTAFAAAETFSPQASISLFAQWASSAQATLTYDGNGSTSGAVPTALVASGTYVVIDSNTGSLAKTGFVFSGWNTAADGTGTTYQGTDNYLLSSDVRLYAKWVVASYTLTFAGNGNTGGTVPASVTGISVSTTLPNNTGNLVKAGFSFTGWNTLPSGLGTNYATGSSFSPTADTILYAKWTSLPTYTITYDANGATSGGVPVAQSGVYSSVTLDNNSGNLAKTNYFFAGWNTAADGTGTTYAASSSYTPSANITLYALWTIAATYTITYNSNSSTSGTPPLPQTGITSSATVSANTGSLGRLGYRFDGWNTVAAGSGTAYAAGDTITPGADVTLYAQWVAVPTYTITYNGNGQTSGSVPSPLTSSDASVTLAGNTGVLNKTNFTFNGWNTLANGTGTHYDAGSVFALNANTTLYAEWLGNIYTITYNANGATSGSVPTQTSGRGTLTAAQNTGELAKTAYTFAGWNTASDGTGTNVAVGGSYTPTANTTLFAKWNAIPTYTITFNANGATGGTVPSALTNVYLQQTVPGNSGSLTLAARVFTGWNANASGTGTSYAVGSTFTPSQNLTLYAVWNVNYSITYDANGATAGNVPATQSGLAGSATVATNSGQLSLTGYNFAGWNTAAGGTGTNYAAGASITSNADVTLYAKWTLIPTFDISYNANGATSGSAPASQLGVVSATIAANSGNLVKSGYNFVGWNDQANGAGTAYATNASITPTQNIVLYANWVLIPNYTITYDDNGSTGGSTAMSASGISAATILDSNSGSLVKQGFIFGGWNTQADGLGTTYAAGASFTPTSNVTLYALWTAVAPAQVGPKFSVTKIAKRQFDLGGGNQTIFGKNLDVVTYVSLSGQKLVIISSSESALTFAITAQQAGWAHLELRGDGATLTFNNFVQFVDKKSMVFTGFFAKGTLRVTEAQIGRLALEVIRAREFKTIQLSFGTTVAPGSSSMRPISLKDNIALLKIAMRLSQLLPKSVDVTIRVNGNSKDLVMTFNNS